MWCAERSRILSYAAFQPRSTKPAPAMNPTDNRQLPDFCSGQKLLARHKNRQGHDRRKSLAATAKRSSIRAAQQPMQNMPFDAPIRTAPSMPKANPPIRHPLLAARIVESLRSGRLSESCDKNGTVSSPGRECSCIVGQAFPPF
jgi:hypothetical protein